jgi:hopene-associated glycosyltransferase HpnB
MSDLIALIGLIAWVGLLGARGGFWRMEASPLPPAPKTWPTIAVVVPARDEAALIGASLTSLLAQDYPGQMAVVVVDDASTDGTAEAARAVGDGRLTVIGGRPLPPGWSGKVWAMSQGVEHALEVLPEARYVLFTDADIHHHPGELARMVTRAEAWRLDMASLMVRLQCRSRAEHGLVPAFVYFFRLLYPFTWVNDQAEVTAAAAGGLMLVRRRALERIGGLQSLRGALIDDCALAAAVKDQGGRLWLGMAGATSSLRPTSGWRGMWRNIARSAYAQLDHSPLRLAATVAAMAVVFLAPPLLTLTGSIAAVAAWGLMALSFLPMLGFYRASPLWAPLLPLIAAFFLAATLDSARRHYAGRGGAWKGRVQLP